MIKAAALGCGGGIASQMANPSSLGSMMSTFIRSASGLRKGFLQAELAVLGRIDVVPMIHEEVQETGSRISLLVFNNEQS